MMRVGVLSNAHSRRNQSALPAIERMMAEFPDVTHRSFTCIDAMPAALAALERKGVEHLVINGGDGTVQAVLGELFERSPFSHLPRVTLVGGGMTNVIAHDVGVPNSPVDALRRILSRTRSGDPGETMRRAAIAVKCSGRGRTEYGFLAGAVGFYQGTRLTRRDMHRVGFRQSLATKAGIVWSVMRLLLHGEGERSGLRGERVAIGLNGSPPQEAPYLFILATTLERLLPGVMPFWGHDHGAIKLTTIASPAPRFGRAAFSVVRGRPRPWMHHAGYASTRADRISLHLTSPIVVDGEVFDPGPHGHVELSAGPVIEFHRY
ncbi:diacylglycerol/lipid kinase family protein [Dongia deserti]|uniref:diacylglycerol/lipid kinase family protein n=1 Tax=Dongia deserti TaxID=2268030 RepID=UPI000E645F8E|nr:diacylglycerol kinase family protein [Dongia deserti]